MKFCFLRMKGIVFSGTEQKKLKFIFNFDNKKTGGEFQAICYFLQSKD
jgi:hypothetical protein